MILRDYQEAAVKSIFDYFDEGYRGNPLVAMPTGTGKSLVITEFIKKAFMLYPGQRFMMLTHVKELIEQNYKTLNRVWPLAPAGIYSSGLKSFQAHFPITFAGIASVHRDPQLFKKVDLVFIDEAHLVSPKSQTMYQRFIKGLKEINSYIKVIGFTATHYRMGQGLLTESDGLFTDICFDLTYLHAFNWLIDQGYICNLIPKRTTQELDITNVQIQNGEYVQSQLQDAVDKQEVTKAALNETIALANGRNHWLVFASGINHTIHIADMLNHMGVEATCVHSKMHGAERDRNILDYKSGRYRAMVNNGILTTGFDFPEMDMIVMLRPTQSPGLWVQMLGRGTRPVYEQGYNIETKDGRLLAQKAGPKKNCLVLDFAGNTRRLGPINDPVMPKRKGTGGGSAPIKICPECGTYNHASVLNCINCGAMFLRHVKLEAKASTAELIYTPSTEVPVVEKFRIDRITYDRHKKLRRPDSLRVSYYCGLRMFQEWICLEHEGYARKKAYDWWRSRSPYPLEDSIPPTITDAMAKVEFLKIPKFLKVWINKQHPDIMGVEY